MLAAGQDAGEIATPSDYAAQRLVHIEHMQDASPQTIDRLREHWDEVTGHEAEDDEMRREVRRNQKFVQRLEREELIVPDPGLLGASGIAFGDELHTANSLHYQRSIIAMASGAVLDQATGAEERSTIWEIGPGWGGLAYQLKTLFPNATYVLTDFPERFLFSATYLMTAFPEASFAFHEEGREIDWSEHDFVFVPNFSLDALPDRIDLTIALSSLEEMTTAQVESHVAHAYERGCPFFFSFGRDRAPGNSELVDAHQIVTRSYWPHESDVAPPGADQPESRADESAPDAPRYVIGWRRVRL
jgi:putative sugar O-methyltransferase